jgi:hypothetical protein
MNLSALTSLSATLLDLNTVMTSAVEGLSSLPQLPYQFAKELLFEKDHKFPTIDEVEIPEGVTPEGMAAMITEIETNYQKTLIDTITNPQDYNIQTPDNHLSILAELSGDNTYTVTQEKFKNYIEYLEMVQSINIDSITKDNAVEMINKLGYYYLNMLNKKTIK